jgi:tungstate transport system substrate-binding protein
MKPHRLVNRLRTSWGGVVLLAALTPACSSPQAPSLTLATTTSTQDSGLLDELVPRFKSKTGIEVKVVAVGTGQALEIGRRGDADVLLVHDPAAEERFMAAGFGQTREEVMRNDFVLVGPPTDPAEVKGRTGLAAAFARVAARQACFVSRGDESGTHQKEKQVWKQAGVEPRGDWYVRSGQGMGALLRMAAEKRAYTLTDRATFLALRQGLDLAVLCEGAADAVNRYSVIVVSPERHPHVKQGPAKQFAAFLLSEEGQQLIAEFGAEKYGRPLFSPKEGRKKP